MTHNKRYSGKSETSLLYIMFMVSDMQSRLARSISIFIISLSFCIISCYMMWQLCVCHRSCHKKCLTHSTTVVNNHTQGQNLFVCTPEVMQHKTAKLMQMLCN